MIPSREDLLQYAWQEIQSAESVWAEEFHVAGRSLRIDDLSASASRIRGAFERFMDAYGYLRVVQPGVPRGVSRAPFKLMRLAERQVDLGFADASFVAIARSLDLLRGGANERFASEAMFGSTKVYRQLARDFAKSV